MRGLQGRHDAGDRVNERKKDYSNGVRGHSDSGGASRFFYCSKASTSERSAGLERMPAKPGERWPQSLDGGDRRYAAPRQNNHPTVKPLALCRYLQRLVTPPGGKTADLYCGSGSFGIAALLEGFDFIGMEREAQYVQLQQERIAHHARLV